MSFDSEDFVADVAVPRDTGLVEFKYLIKNSGILSLSASPGPRNLIVIENLVLAIMNDIDLFILTVCSFRIDGKLARWEEGMNHRISIAKANPSATTLTSPEVANTILTWSIFRVRPLSLLLSICSLPVFTRRYFFPSAAQSYLMNSFYKTAEPCAHEHGLWT